MKTIAIISGGMDSSTLLYHLVHDTGADVHALTFDYGQRHIKEVVAAIAICTALGVKHTLIDIIPVGDLLTGSALTDNIPVPHGHYEAESMRLTVVPNRNAILLSIAWGVAVAEGAEQIAIGIHSGDHFIYPDCRPAFLDALEIALRLGTEGHRHDNLKFYAPYIHVDKAAIALQGVRLGVPYELTWTCYEGGETHCGQCGACTERREAFEEAGLIDPTTYVHN